MNDILGLEGAEIVLDAGLDVEEISQTPTRVDYEYVQSTIKGIKRSFKLFDDLYLNYCIEHSNPKAFNLKVFRDKNVAEVSVNLTYIDPKPERKRYVAWGWFFAALLAMLVAFVMIYVGEYSRFTLKHEAVLPSAIVLASFGLIALMVSFYKTQHKVIYKSFASQIPIFELFYMPRKKPFKDFMKALDISIVRAQQRKGATLKYRLAAELKYLRKISQAGIIAEADYEKARGVIFRHKEYQA